MRAVIMAHSTNVVATYVQIAQACLCSKVPTKSIHAISEKMK